MLTVAKTHSYETRRVV